MRREIGRVIAITVLATVAASAAAATYDLSWTTVAGGGATFTAGGSYTMGSTTGQAAAAPIAAGTNTLQAGFWAVQAGPAAPVVQGKASRKVHTGAGTFNLPIVP